MNYNNSATIDPRPVVGSHEAVTLACMGCGKEATKRLAHSLTDAEIMAHFSGWQAKGFSGCQRTLCPNCSNNVSPTTGQHK